MLLRGGMGLRKAERSFWEDGKNLYLDRAVVYTCKDLSRVAEHKVHDLELICNFKIFKPFAITPLCN